MIGLFPSSLVICSSVFAVTLNPPAVVAMTTASAAPGSSRARAQAQAPAMLAHAARLMPPPSTLPSRGPRFQVPGPASSSIPGVSFPSGAMGYGSQHLHYASQRDHWANLAHQSPKAETIIINFSALHEVPRRKGIRGDPIGVCHILIPRSLNGKSNVTSAGHK